MSRPPTGARRHGESASGGAATAPHPGRSSGFAVRLQALQQSRIAKLRPAKVHTGLRRRWFEYEMPRRIRLRKTTGLVDMGSKPGGWTFPTDLLEPSWLCYLVGAGGDIDVDLDLIHGYGVTVRSFDAVADYVTIAREQARGEPHFGAHHAAIAMKDGPIRMQPTHHPGSRSVSAAQLYDTHEFIELPGRTLPSLMAEMGDSKIDLLKLDIEGSEYELVPSLDLGALGVKVFAVQFHHNGSVAEAEQVIKGLGDQGYDPVACRPAVKVTFARADLI